MMCMDTILCRASADTATLYSPIVYELHEAAAFYDE